MFWNVYCGCLMTDFSGLVLGFSSAALYYLGEVSLEHKGPTPNKNLDLARQNIDILELLQDKCRGNLTEEEDRLLKQVLADLRIKFVARSQDS